MSTEAAIDDHEPEASRSDVALGRLLAAFDGTPGSTQALVEFEAGLWSSGERATAVHLTRSLVCLDPSNLAFLMACGARLAKLGALPKARVILEIAARRSATMDRKIASRLAACYVGLGRPETAIRLLREAAVAFPTVPQIRTQLALTLAEHGAPGEAGPELRRAAELCGDRSTLNALLEAAARLDDPGAALAVWRAAGQPLDDDPPGFLSTVGVQMARAGDWLPASAALGRGVRCDPANVLAGLWLDWVRRRLAWNDEPVEVRYEGRTFDLSRPGDYETLARAMAQNQHSALSRAVVDVLRAQVALTPDPVGEHMRLGLVHHGLVESHHAVEELSAALRFAPDDVPCLVAYARALELDRRRTDAIETLVAAIGRLPDAPELVEVLAEIKIRWGAGTEALDLARTGVRRFPDYHSLQTIVANLAQQAGLYDEASEALQAAFRLRQPQLREIEELTLMLMILGRHEEAAATLAQGLAATGRRQTMELRAALADAVRVDQVDGIDAAVDRLRRSVRDVRANYSDFRRVGMLLFLSKAEREAGRGEAVLRKLAARSPGDQSTAAHLFYFLFGLNRIPEALSHWLDVVGSLCPDRNVLPERPFQAVPPVVRPTTAPAAAAEAEERTFGLVIQGPVTHRGFDCRDNINRLVADFGDRFKAVVLSTWEGEADPGLQGENCHTLFNRDTSPARSREGMPLRNRVRQMLSTKLGVDHLRKLGGVDYVIKIRTDLHADLPVLCEHVVHCERNFSDYVAVGQRNFIFTPPMQLDGPYLTGDVMFAGHIDDFENYLLATLETETDVFRPYKNLPESDVTLKHLYRNLRPVLGVPDYMNFPIIRKSKPAIPYPKGLIDYWAVAARYSLAPMPRRLFETAVFRGGELPMNHLSYRRVDFETWAQMPADWAAHAATATEGWYDLEADAFDQAYFYYLEKAAEMAGVRFSGDLRRALGDYRVYVERVKSAVL